MSLYPDIALITGVFFALLIPPGLAIYASAKLHKTFGGGTTYFLSGGFILLTILSLDIVATWLISFVAAEFLTQYVLYKSYISAALNYAGLLSIGMGMIFISNCHKRRKE